MQFQYIKTLASKAPQYGDIDGDYFVIDVSGEFPENGYSYDDMRAGLCHAYVMVTLEKQRSL